MTTTLCKFFTYKSCLNNRKVVIVEGSLLTIVGVRNEKARLLKDVLYVPKLSKSFVSIKKLVNNPGCKALFTNYVCVI